MITRKCAMKREVLIPWTQPILTSNTSYGTVSAGTTSTATGQKPFNALDGVKTGISTANCWTSNTTSATWWKWVLPVNIYITKLILYNRNIDNFFLTGQFFTASDKLVPIGDWFSAAQKSWGQTVVFHDPHTPIKTNTIYFARDAGNNQWSGIGELAITAFVKP